MSSLFISAWLISLISAGYAWICARNAGLPLLYRCFFAAIFFPAPLFAAIGGNNSFIYLLDILFPFAFLQVIKHYYIIPKHIFYIAIILLAGIGILPFATSLIYADRMDILYNIVNLYRLIGGLSLLCIFAAYSRRNKIEYRYLLNALSFFSILILITMMLQGKGLINTDVYYGIIAPSDFEVDDIRSRFVVLGMFRATIGIFGMMSFISLLVGSETEIKAKILRYGGAISGILIILLCGSKTSFIAVFLCTFALIALFPKKVGNLYLRLFLLTAIALFMSVHLFPDYSSDTFIPATVGVFAGKQESLEGFEVRQDIWTDSLSLLKHHSEIYFDIHPRQQDQMNFAHYHDDYLATLMVGGIYCAFLYILGLLAILIPLFKYRSLDKTPITMGVIVFVAGAFQAGSVNHLLPGLLYGSAVSLYMVIYGLAFGNIWNQIPPEEISEEVIDITPNPLAIE